MLRFVLLTAIAILLVFGRATLADDDVSAETQTAQPNAAADSPAGKQPAQSGDSSRPDKWRYVRKNGRWWYWTAKNRWLYWSEPQGWVAYQAPAARAQVPARRAPAGDSWRWGWDPANPFDRHPPGRPLNSPRMFPKNM